MQNLLLMSSEIITIQTQPHPILGLYNFIKYNPKAMQMLEMKIR